MVSKKLTIDSYDNIYKFLFIHNEGKLTFAVQILKIYVCYCKNCRSAIQSAGRTKLVCASYFRQTGDKVEFSDILSFVDGDGKLSAGKDAKAVVKAEIVNELVKGEKVIAFKMKRRKGFRKKHGHRTHYTRIKIESIA